jgi:secretion/DNA translocation related TadE-like protein
VGVGVRPSPNMTRRARGRVRGGRVRTGWCGSIRSFVPSRVGPGSNERGSASIWVLTGGVLVLSIALVVMVRTTAVLARHRAEAAADLSALAAAAGIGVDASSSVICARALRIARVNGADLRDCQVRADPSGRSGEVRVRVSLTVRLAGIGTRTVNASARAGRLPS